MLCIRTIAALILGIALTCQVWGAGDAGAIASTNITSLLIEGKNRLNTGDVTGALQAYETVLAKDANNREALYFAGNISLQLNQPDKGLKYLARAVVLSPDDIRLHLLLAQAFERFASLDDAIRVYQEIIDIAPATPEGIEAEKRFRFLSGKRFLAQGNPKKAQEIFSDLANDYPKDSTILTDIKAANQAREQTRAAVAGEQTTEKLAEASRYSSSDVPTLLSEGKTRLAKNDAKGALQAYEAVLTKDANNVEALFFAGNLNLQLKQPEPGLKYLSHAVEITPRNNRLRLVLAQAYEQFTSPDKAMEEYQEIIKNAPGTPEGKEADKHYRLLSGKRFINQGDPRKALEILTGLLNDYPKDQSINNAIEAANQLDYLMHGTVARETVTGAGPAPSAAFAALVAEGKNRLKENDAKGALQIFESVLAKDANNLEAIFYAGRLYLLLNQPEKGLKYLARSVELAPNNPTLRLMLAQAYEQYAVLDEAAKQYQQIVAMTPSPPEAREANQHYRVILGKRALDQGNTEQALELFTSLLKDYPKQPALLTGLVNAYIGAKRLEDAKHLLEVAVSASPDDQLAHTYLADLYERTNELQKAAEQYEIVVKLLPPQDPQINPITVKFTMMKGVLALTKGAYQEARDHFERVIPLTQNNLLARLNLAIAYRGMGNRAKAEETLLNIMKQNPDYLEARLRLGAIYLEENKPDDAAREFEEVRIRAYGTPVTNQAAQYLSKIYSSRQGNEIKTRVQDALIKDAKEPLAKEPDNFDAWSRLAVMYMALERHKDALEAYENVVRIKPEDARAQESLAGLYEETNDLTKAEAAHTQARDHTQDPAAKKSIEQKLAMVSSRNAFNDKKYDAAESGFKEVISGSPNNFIAHFYLGLIYSLNGKTADAAHEFEEVIRIVPTHSQAHYRLGLLYEQLLRDEDALSEYRTTQRLPIPQEVADGVKQRIEAVEKRMDGFDYSVGYSINYINNANQTKKNPVDDFHSDVTGSINYRHKLERKPIYVGMSVGSTYSTYHVSQSDSLNTSFTPYASFSWKGLDFNTSVSHSNASTLITNTPVSSSSNLNGDVAHNFKMRALLPWLAPAGQRTAIATTWRFNAGASTYKSASSALFDANNFTLGWSLSQDLGNGWRYSGNYNWSDNINTDKLGSDFAYTNNSVSVQISKFLSPRLSANAGYSYIASNYSNPDSFTLFKTKRKNSNHNLSAGLNFFLDQNLRLYANAAYIANTSNLPTGYILNPENVRNAVGFQSASLGDYSYITVSAGVSFSF